MKKLNLATLLFLIYGMAFPQQQKRLGLNPHNLGWKQINTEKFQLVFPNYLNEQAQRTASLLEYLYDSGAVSIGQKRQKVTVLLQNQTTISNGFVALAPWRSELFMTPPQVSFVGSANWSELLAIHEYRHIQQFSNARRGLTGLASYAFGNFGWSTLAFIATPRWFFEGDAVCYETALSASGRGRLPLFTQEWMALVREKRFFGYEKASARSYRDYIPNHYVLGYFMTSYARQTYGSTIWEKVFNRASAYRSPFYPFSRSLKKFSGLSTRKLYLKMQDQLDSVAKSENYPLTHSRKLNYRLKKRYTNYEIAQFLDNQTLVFEKSSLNQIPSFYTAKIFDPKENYIFEEEFQIVPGINTSGKTLSAAQKSIVWAQMAFHPRWGYKDYSIIKIYDTVKKKLKKITSKSRLFSPALSPNGSKIAAVQHTDTLKVSLVIISRFPEIEFENLPNPENYFIQTPKWIDNERIVAVLQKDNRNALAVLENGEWRLLTQWQTAQLAYPFAQGSYVYFVASFSGNNEIYRIKHSENAPIEQITSTLNGATMPTVSPNGRFLVYSEYTSMGYDLKIVETSFIVPIEIQASRKNYAQTLTQQENLGEVTQSFPLKSYPTSNYKKTSDLFHLHSWSPFVFPPIYSLGLFLDNKISTLSGSLQYELNLNESAGNWVANLDYGERFAVLGATFQTRNRRASQIDTLNIGNDRFLTIRTQLWRENSTSLGFKIPLNLTNGAYLTSLSLQNNLFVSQMEFQAEKDKRFTGIYTHFQSLLTFRRLRYTSQQEVLPRLGQAFQLRYLNMLPEQKLIGEAIFFNSQIYFPGLLRSHGFYLMADYRKEDFNHNYKFPNYFFEVRGFQNVLPNSENTKFSINYMLPLFYPDLPLGPLAFIKRVRANLFYDHSFPTKVSPFPAWQRRSYGCELIFDLRFLRLLDLSLGLRHNRFFNPKPLDRLTQWEIVFFGVGL